MNDFYQLKSQVNQKKFGDDVKFEHKLLIFINDDISIFDFLPGFAYTNQYKRYWSSKVTELRWLSNLTCTGNEDRIDECDDLSSKWGRIENCSIYGFAAAFCYTESGM